MLHRIVAMFIVGFWLAMTGLLIVRELYPEATQLNAVPVSYVGRLMFQHQQPSNLKVYSGSDEIGYINIEPKPVTASGARILLVRGNLAIRPLVGSEQRISWQGAIEMDAGYGFRGINKLTLSLQHAQQLVVDVSVPTNTATFVVRDGPREIEHATITLDKEGLSKLLGLAGLDAGLLRHLHTGTAQMPSPEFSAQQSSTKLGGEKLSTYLLSMKIDGQAMFEAHISQLGQVLRARAPFMGYQLLPDNVAP